MNEVQTLILRGCKFMLGLGGERWNSTLTKKAIARLRDLCKLQLDEWETPTVNTEATPEFAEKLFGKEQNAV